MIRHVILILLTLLIFNKDVETQTLDDAIRYSHLNRIGSARGFGLSNAMGSIGGDFGSLASNPAGIGMYHWSEFQFTPGLYDINTSSTLLGSTGNSTGDDRTRLMIPSVSYVQVNRLLDKHWTRRSFAIGVNRIANFNQKFTYRGNQDNSITQYFIEQSGFNNPDVLDQTSPFIGLPAYDAYITTYDTYIGDYFADIDENEVVEKVQTISRKGGIDEITAAIGGDYGNKLQVGASISFPIIFFKEKKQYTESLTGHPIFNELEFDENLTTQGSGVNIKLGAKYILAKKIHISGAFHSPTWYRITEEFDNRANYQYIFDPDIFDQPGPQEGLSPLGSFEYSFRSPWRAIGGLGVVIGKLGFISGELEYVNYRSAKFNIIDDPSFEDQLNDEIKDNLGSSIIIRSGVELRPTKKIRLRGGIALEESVFEVESGLEQANWSAGAGYWFGNKIFVDAAYRRTSDEQNYQPYRLNRRAAPLVESEVSAGLFILTFGMRW